MPNEALPHLFVEGRFQTEKYASPRKTRKEVRLPVRDRTSHATALRDQLNQARAENERQRGVTARPAEPAPIVLEIRSEPEFRLLLDSLEDRRKGIEVACVRTEGEGAGKVQVATVHVPQGALTHFFKRVEQYLSENTKGTARTPPHPTHQELIETIAQLRLATLRSFWTDAGAPFPAEDQSMWWEVWLRASGGENPWDAFRRLAESKGLRYGTETIRFPDRCVGLLFGSAAQLSSSADLLDVLAEVRQARENPAPFLSLTPQEQADWVEAFLPRLTPPSADAPAVCVLDAGVILHPLIQPALDPADCHRFDPSWPLADTPGPAAEPHGTELAGVALYADRLADHLAGSGPFELRHRLESVRILPPRTSNDPRLYGFITSQAASRVEITAPTRARAFCLAVTTDGRDLGRPTSWSGGIDQLCAGIADGNPRLFVISAGNSDPNQRSRYPDSNDTDPVQDPAQAWNAITVGACTELWRFDQANPAFSGCEPIAPRGDLSPSSTTSISWSRDWPIKPDIVLEGGNQLIRPGTGTVSDPEQMAMLTTAHAATGALFSFFRDTSAAAAQAARMAAILQAEYPALWPEMVRALLIHSAEWTDAMRRPFGTQRPDHVNRLRRYGYGTPSLDRARHSARNSLTLLVQQSIQPYVKEQYKDMGLHDLPWPKEQLLALGERTVAMRVTLSYFIEPKPGRREGFAKARHHYQSHGLRFEVRRPGESLNEFRQRVSKAARDEDETYKPVGDTSGWVLGPQVRTRGSVHSDWWTGRAADLAVSGHIAVYPVSGWWREAQGDHWKKEARYALVVSIRTEEQGIDIYTPVKAMIEAPVEVESEVESA